MVFRWFLVASLMFLVGGGVSQLKPYFYSPPAENSATLRGKGEVKKK